MQIISIFNFPRTKPKFRLYTFSTQLIEGDDDRDRKDAAF